MGELAHFGTKRHSGRYPWGSGGDPYQRSIDFLNTVEEYRKRGMGRTEIAEAMGINTSQYDARTTLSVAIKRAADYSRAQILKETGMSNAAIGREMNLNESSVRSLLDPAIHARSQQIFNTMKVIRDNVNEKKFVDVGAGIEQQLGISRTKLNAAVNMLKEEGYNLYELKQRQQTTDHITILRVMTPPDVTKEDLRKNHDKVKMIQNYTDDGGLSWEGIEPPQSVKRSRVMIRYGDEGGSDRDGLIELRRNVPDIALGNARYAQVRIAVDGKHYMKGMALHSDNIPDGVDMVYNTNKKKGTPDEKVFKPLYKESADDPFGTTIRQKYYVDQHGKKQLSALNIVGSTPGAGEEGAWGEWSKTLSSQFLSKQPVPLAKKQLAKAYATRAEEFDEIMSLTNPSVRKRLLETFSDNCDSAAVHLKAAALDRQSSYVLLPFTSIKENEIFAPKFRDGETVVLVRHPHGGTFEIPELTVNNKNREAISAITRDAKDAVGIHPKTAQRLSGADFDGDTVLVIPNNNGDVRTKPALKGLLDFDPKIRYPYFEGMKVMTAQQKGLEMGKISNLITDMTLGGAKDSELAAAVRHSMVVIDAEKHKLNYRQSELDNNIALLKTRYQGGPKAGAATLISRASSDQRIPHRRPARPDAIDPKTGKKLWENTGETYVKTGEFLKDKTTGKYLLDENGNRIRKEYRTPKIVKRQTVITKMEYHDDANDLSSGTPMEAAYAQHANALKALANRARKASVEIESIPYSPSAREVYAKEYETLKSKLNIAYRNKPLERQAQIIAGREVASRIKENPAMDDDHLKKIKGKALTAARLRVGAQKNPIEITDTEWEAIQAGALSSNFLREILLNTDLDLVRQRSMPRASNGGLSPARTERARSMRANGATTADIAQALGVSTSAIDKALA